MEKQTDISNLMKTFPFQNYIQKQNILNTIQKLKKKLTKS